ncbi:MAG: tetratricopeptide repeat protein [Ignavibacteria bacterium]|jgi:tetratricopeptide (TPR) repeat protein|nr:tetratricopeptide repeat protein [Ignavibacteria bacterium]MDH7527079.1 tetratricopeptide repeat protein [Ignavibacteria bacterium]
MLAPKKKISKKEIKQDKLVETYFKAKTFFEENQKTILIGLGSFVVIVFLIIYFVRRSGEREIEATTMLGNVINLYDQGQYQQAIDGVPAKKIRGLKYIADEYGNTESGEAAKIFLANSYYQLGKIDEALKYYEDYDGDNKLFQATALAGAAACYELKGNKEEAAKLYVKAAKVASSEVSTPEYLLYAARLNAELGKKDEAKKLLDLIKKEYQNSAQARDYERYIVEFQIPVE